MKQRKPIFFLVCSTAFVCALPVLSWAGAESIERFAKVKTWRLTVRWEFKQLTPKGTNPEKDIFVKGTAEYKLVAQKKSGKDKYLWKTEKKSVPKGEFKSDFRVVYKDKGQVVRSEEGGSEGWREGAARFDIYPDKGEFRLHAIAGSKENKAVYKNKGVPTQTLPFFVPITATPPCMEWIDKVPDAGIQITGERKDVPCPILQAENTPMNVSFTLAPWDMEPPPEVEVDIEGYAQWRPQSGEDIVVNARLKDKDKEKSKLTVKQFIFELLDTSKLPGECCNDPVTNATTGYDLDFLPVGGDSPIIPSQEGQVAKTPEGEFTRTAVKIECWDYGASGRLKVTALLQDGTKVVGHLADDESGTEIRLPKSAPESKIAEAWKKKNGADGLADDSDLDDSPKEGDGCQGDGLTLFEEYRGFMLEGTHASTDPRKKDFFLVNKIGPRARQGVDLVTGATHLTAHYVTADVEADGDGVVNTNHGNAPHLANKWAVIMETSQEKAQRWTLSYGEGLPGGPKHVRISSGEDPAWQAMSRSFNGRILTDRYASVLAHEILHTLGVGHHGNCDPGYKLWDKQVGPDGLLEIREYGMNLQGNTTTSKVIQVYKEDGTFVSPTSRAIILPMEVWVACEGGEHSGMEDCIMRYNSAMAYTRPGKPDVRYLADEEMPGIYLCTGKTGTGVNMQGRSPWPRYGDASSGGDCMHQFCVNDAKHK